MKHFMNINPILFLWLNAYEIFYIYTVYCSILFFHNKKDTVTEKIMEDTSRFSFKCKYWKLDFNVIVMFLIYINISLFARFFHHFTTNHWTKNIQM